MLPNYLIIGAARAATTWLHECLSEHPQVYTPEIKELHFFSAKYQQGIDSYESYFKGAAGGGYATIGEASPTYLPHPEAAQRIAQSIPRVKMIVVLRHPIERAYSFYRKFRKDYNNESFEAVIEKFPTLVTDGCYHQHIMRYLNYFDRNQLLIKVFDDIEVDAHEFVRDVYNYLGIDSGFCPSVLRSPVNMAIDPGLGSLAMRVSEWGIVKLIRNTPLETLARRLVHRQKDDAEKSMQDETHLRLQRYFEEPNMKLAKLLGRDLSNWNGVELS